MCHDNVCPAELWFNPDKEVLFCSGITPLTHHKHGTGVLLFVHAQVGREQTIFHFFVFVSHAFCLLCQRNDL